MEFIHSANEPVDRLGETREIDFNCKGLDFFELHDFARTLTKCRDTGEEVATWTCRRCGDVWGRCQPA